jgi:hypothetical protein
MVNPILKLLFLSTIPSFCGANGMIYCTPEWLASGEVFSLDEKKMTFIDILKSGLIRLNVWHVWRFNSYKML